MSEVVRVKCPHRIGLCYRDGDLLRLLPCDCNDPSEVLEIVAQLPDATPTPVPSEATEAGEACHRGYPYCDGRRPCACPCHDPAEPDAGEVEALAQHIYEASDCYEEDGTGWENQQGSPRREAMTQARAVLASDWLADYVRRATR